MRALSLSGGGFQALYTALCLTRLEAGLGVPLREKFGVFVGTSAGGMIAAAAAVGMPMQQVCEIFIKEGKRIFSDRPAPRGAAAIARDTVRFVRAPKYDGSALRRTVDRFCGDLTLGDMDRDLMLTSVRLRDAQPILFCRQTHPHVRLADAVMASAAAPLMFPAVLVGGDLHADGAIFANNPDALALDYAENALGVSRADISVLGLGAMSCSPPLSEPSTPHMGITGWLSENRIFRTMIGSQTAITEMMMRNALGDAYTRIDVPACGPGRDNVALDVADIHAIDAIRAAAQESEPALDALMARMLGESPSP